LERTGKRIRKSVVDLVFAMAGGTGNVPACLGEAIEWLHAGSLVIDDIQDESPMRRGMPALHLQIGVPLALNAGNWMYFRALELAAAALDDPAQSAALVGRFIAVARQCHEGQAIDLAMRIDEVTPRQAQVTALAISRWKTGRLASLAAWCGAKAAAGDPQTLKAVAAFGCRMGICLQMKNDFDELCELVDGSDRCDDLRNRRVTWPWAWAASELSARQFTAWQSRLRQVEEQQAEFRSLAKDLLDATHRRAAAAINTRLDRAIDRLTAATGTAREVGPLAAICNALRIASEPPTAVALP
jgi:geranylgeranyl pyrophosphate synthase